MKNLGFAQTRGFSFFYGDFYVGTFFIGQLFGFTRQILNPIGQIVTFTRQKLLRFLDRTFVLLDKHP
jgi:hypothetical protein